MCTHTRPRGEFGEVCPQCFPPDKFITILKYAILKCKKYDNEVLARKLSAVLAFLPNSPVMGVLEAEHHQLRDDFISMLMGSFNVLPLR